MFVRNTSNSSPAMKGCWQNSYDIIIFASTSLRAFAPAAKADCTRRLYATSKEKAGYIAMSRLKKTIFVAVGFIFVGIGAVGIVLPLLPTTPFLLLATILFSKSNDRFRQWLLRNRVFGPYLAHYESGAGVPKPLKIKTIAFLWPSLAISGILINAVWAWFLLAIVGICVTTHVLTIKKRSRPNKTFKSSGGDGTLAGEPWLNRRNHFVKKGEE